MALRLSYTDPASGTAYPEAYLHLDDVEIPSLYQGVTFMVAIYRDQDAFDAHLAPVMATRIWLSVDKTPAIEALREQFREASYGLLAQLPQFAGATPA